jgi:hypothetical protein
VPGRGADRLRLLQTISETSFLLVAGGARDTTIRTQSRIEEQLLAEFSGYRIIGDSIAGVRRQVWQRFQPQ